VIASATDLEPGVVDVITGGKIYLSTSSTTVPVNEKSEIIVTTKDVNGVPINYIGTIKLSVESTDGGFGTLSPDAITFDGSTSSISVIFTATSEGAVNVIAYEDPYVILEGSEPLSLKVTLALVPHHIEVYANPSNIQAGSTDTSTITAKIKNEKNVTINSYTEPITFTTSSGNFPNGSISINTSSAHVTYKDGVATVKFYPLDVTGENATITVTSYDTINNNNITGNTVISFHLKAHNILLNAYPANIKVKGKNPDTCAITATIVDKNEKTVTDYKGKVKFSIIEGDAKFALTGSTLITVVNGKAQIILQAGNTTGLVRVKATSSDMPPEYIDIPVIDIQLEGSPSYIENNIVIFNINVQGAKLLLKEMRVSWDPSSGETLNKIEIKSPSTADPAIIVFNNSTVSSGELIDVTDSTLSTGISNVKMYFSGDISGKTTLDVTFNPNSGDYLIHLKP